MQVVTMEMWKKKKDKTQKIFNAVKFEIQSYFYISNGRCCVCSYYYEIRFQHKIDMKRKR